MKKYLITGGTGSLGRALIRRLLEDKNNKIIVFSRDEGKQALFFGKNPNIVRVIGDIRDFQKLNIAMQLHRPEFVIHAAALKRVDDMEFHPDECIKTNVLGSENVARAAFMNSVKKCILVSTDKACQPVNVYGSSKFIAERIFTNYDYNSTTTVFTSVRYGNVIASRGSFIPLWQHLIKQNKKITVTSMECSRFLFTLEDAVHAVLDALRLAEGGEVFVPKINSYSMKQIVNAIKLMNVAAGQTLEVDVVGLRPGEKIHEDMLAKVELPYTYETDCNLLAILPQYTMKQHSYNFKYTGLEFNSSLHKGVDPAQLVKLIERGCNEARPHE